ncbi:hypothetical protein [Rhizobium laguerreae]|uniref:hypothetical protein n=1 Tax=Rhizobium laguerreae TaxID=1076926 RepID=UPI001FF04B9C|nr:hypothetical protein [Rhizobium laguerreae]
MSLMLDFKCVINPYVVYATERDWGRGSGSGVMSDVLSARFRKCLEVKLELASLLKARRYSSGWEI